MKKIGFTIGKFAPFHKGHEFLIETALEEMDEFYVIIYETSLINISIEERAKWIKNKYPEVEILYAYNPPMKYGLDKECIEIQMKYLINILGNIKPTHFYSSEEYGKYVAEYLNIVDRRVDLARINVPIHASKIRKNILENEKWLNEIVYNDCNKKGVFMIKEKSCGCVIIENNKVLLIRQTKGHWGFPKGHVEEGETEEDTALREVKEETGLDVKIDTKKRYEEEYETDKGTLKTVVLFLANPVCKNVEIQEEEVSDYKWADFDEALQIITYENTKKLFKEIVKKEFNIDLERSGEI